MSDTFDYMLDHSEPTMTTPDQWELVAAPEEWLGTWAKYRDMDSGVIVVLYAHSMLNIEHGSVDIDAGFIDRLQSLKALARKHFGPDWGK